MLINNMSRHKVFQEWLYNFLWNNLWFYLTLHRFLIIWSCFNKHLENTHREIGL